MLDKKYRGKWVALDSKTKEVIVVSKYAGVVVRKVKKLKIFNPIIYKVPHGYYIFSVV